jgi:PIN domain nuclease of toxin-antitoxin system
VTVVLDAYAVIAALVGEPARREVEPHLATACISAANLGEVMDVCVRVHANAESAVRERIDWLLAGGLEVVSLDAPLAIAAGAFRSRRYRRRVCEISLGDSVAAALAAVRRQPLATSDPHLASAAVAEGIRLLPLPDSRGHRPRSGRLGS